MKAPVCMLVVAMVSGLYIAASTAFRDPFKVLSNGPPHKLAYKRPSCHLRRVCYFNRWAKNLKVASTFKPLDIDPALCTHIIYAYGLINTTTSLLATLRWKDLRIIRELLLLKDKNPDLKIMFGVGGWGWSKQFTPLVNSRNQMKTFAQHAAVFLKKHDFDGLAVDWYFPSQTGHKDQYQSLLQILRREFNKEKGDDRLLLSISVSGVKISIVGSYNIRTLSRVVDFINVLAYDFEGSWALPKLIRHHSPLYSRTGDESFRAEHTADWAMRHWMTAGADPKKLVLGLAAYGRSYVLVNTSVTDYGSPFTNCGTKGTYTQRKGILSYFEVCKLIEEGWTKKLLQDMKVPYAYGVRDGVGQWVGYDDRQSFRAKMQYVLDNGFGGAMVWSLNLDDFKGKFCGGEPFTVISEMKESLVCGREPPRLPTTLASILNINTNISTTQKPPSTTQSPEAKRAVEVLRESCKKQDDWRYARDSFDCGTFYVCIHTELHTHHCKEGLAFRLRDTVCDWPMLVPECSILP